MQLVKPKVLISATSIHANEQALQTSHFEHAAKDEQSNSRTYLQRHDALALGIEVALCSDALCCPLGVSAYRYALSASLQPARSWFVFYIIVRSLRTRSMLLLSDRCRHFALQRPTRAHNGSCKPSQASLPTSSCPQKLGG